MKTRRMVTSAMLIALATVLSVLQPFALPFGGGVTIASMMPIVLISYVYGTKYGLFSGFVFSLIQMMLGAKTIAAFFLPGESQMAVWQAVCVCLLDYIIAYTVIGFGGVFAGKLKSEYLSACLGSVFALSMRYLVHIVSGTVFFGAWAEWFFSQEGFYRIGDNILATFSGNTLALVYSVFYNGLYMLPEILITASLTPIVYFALQRANLLPNK